MGLFLDTWTWYACAGVRPARVRASRLGSSGSSGRGEIIPLEPPTDLARPIMEGATGARELACAYIDWVC